MDRIVKVYLGKDGKFRVADVRVAKVCNKPLQPWPYIQRDGTIFCFCFNSFNNRSYTHLTLAKIVLPRDFKYSFVTKLDSLIKAKGSPLPTSYNLNITIISRYFMALAYGVVPQTTAITKEKTNIFLTLGRDMQRIVGHFPPCYKLLCLNKIKNEIFAFCNVKIFKF